MIGAFHLLPQKLTRQKDILNVPIYRRTQRREIQTIMIKCQEASHPNGATGTGVLSPLMKSDKAPVRIPM
ncbi:hypothetical protein HanRHA438_Chr10g0433571 [Helianthus annuus]|nr:hypothetical protein HanRHA438_Chr10g0433571 [Helianthus annuus]